MDAEQQLKRKLDTDESHIPDNERQPPLRYRTKDPNYWTNLLAHLTTVEATDVLRECENVDLNQLEVKADDYLLLAESKLRVFPFKDVKPCWRRLYTDASIIKAAKSIQRSLPPMVCTDNEWADDAINILDMAVIVAGGGGRQELIASIYEEIEAMLSIADDSYHQSKKLRRSEQLPADEHSIPRLKFPVLYVMNKPTLTAFENHMNEVAEPLILQGILEDWPATDKWKSIPFWMKSTLDGRRLVPVEIGRSYVDEDWRQQIMPFSKFLNDFIIDDNDNKGYLAQYDLFHHIPRLSLDVTTPDYCFLDAPAPAPDTPVAKARLKAGSASARLGEGEVQKNVWFGPAWTISPLHHDPYHNILCQVVGKKYVRLCSPKHSHKLYPRAENEPAPHGEDTIDMSNTSTIDVAAIELSPDEDWDEVWPNLSEVPYLEVILEPGQALYIPVGWWHYVRSCSVGVSVSFWW